MSLLSQRVGTEHKEPECITLEAGELTAELVGGNLRQIQYRGHEVLRAIAYLVRDKDWATYTPTLSGVEIDQHSSGFDVQYRGFFFDAETQQRLIYEAHITASAHGSLSFSVAAIPDTPFRTARCGFVILHPLEGVSGHPALIEHVDGSFEKGVFPELISPWQLFTQIRSITHEVAPGISASCRMEGDVFEMEDQRNWSDASYKTYVRPLSLPWPYIMEPGIKNEQSVELCILSAKVEKPSFSGSVTDSLTTIEIGEEDGIFPGIGLSISTEQIEDVQACPSLLEELRPQLLLFNFDQAKGHGLRELSGFAEIARRAQASFPCEISLEVPLSCRADPPEEIREIAALIDYSGLPLSSVMIGPDVDRVSTPPGRQWPDCPSLQQIYDVAREVFPKVSLGGGVLTFFTELNRNRPPLELLDYISHCTNPIVHAADDRSLMQTLESLPYIVRSTRAFLGNVKRYRIGPSTIGMRSNPYGSKVMENSEGRRRVMTRDDPRQTALFAAAWMVGYLAATSEGHLDALTVGALTGPLGISSTTSGTLRKYPAFHVTKGLIELGHRPRYACCSSDPSKILASAGLAHNGQLALWISNLTNETQRVILPGSLQIDSLSVLGEQDLTALRLIAVPKGDTDGRLTLGLSPYSTIRAAWRHPVT